MCSLRNVPWTYARIGEKLDLRKQTVLKWRKRFLQSRLDGLHDEPRPGVKRTITDEQVEMVVVKTLEQKPPNATHWSTRSMAEATGISRSTVHRIWKAFGLQPHRVETFKLSTDPQFIVWTVDSGRFAAMRLQIVPGVSHC